MKLSTLGRPLNWLWKGCISLATAFYFNWGLTYARWGQPYRALWYMDRALRLSSHRADVHYNRGLLNIAMSRTEVAARDLDAAIRLNPRYAAAYSLRVLVYSRLGKHEEAQQDVERAVELGVSRTTLESQIQELKNRIHPE